VAALLLATLGLGVGPALADDPPPPLVPPGVSAPTPTVRPSSGPTFVVTPGDPGGDLGAPDDGSEPTPKKGVTQKKPSAKPTSSAAPVAAPQAEPVSSVGVSSSEALSWKLGAGALLLFVLGEFLRIEFRRRPTGA
jgi:hypothetical protein